MCEIIRQAFRNDYQIKAMDKLKASRKNASKGELIKEYKLHHLSLEDEEVEQFEEEYKIYFENPKQLIEAIDKIEEDNLQVIQMIQDNEQAFFDVQQKLRKFDTEKNSKINCLAQTKDELNQRIKNCEEEIRFTQKKSDNFEKEEFGQSLEKVKEFLYQIFHQFKGDFEKHHSMDSFKELEEKQGLMFVLLQIESLIYRFSLALKKENPHSVFKSVILLEVVLR